MDSSPIEDESKAIQPISKDTVHRICSGQVVLSLAIAMKELVENAIDAGARIIDIHLKEYGSELLEVSDNGSGVQEDDFQKLTLKHYTSKLREFNDLERIATLGFRGEALSSLCALADVEVITRHTSAPTATKLRYNFEGQITSQEVAARGIGTTVRLKNLFSTLPVRKKEFTKNLKREYSKMCALLYAYCLLPNGVKYNCTNATLKNSSALVLATQGLADVRENIVSVFGVKQLASLVDVNLVKPEREICEEFGIQRVDEEMPFEFQQFLISSATHGSGRSSSDRQFYYINNRPCEPSKLIKLVNEVYKQFNSKQYPFVYLNVITKKCLVDVNITPDKRQVFVEEEKLLLAAVKASMLEAFKFAPSTLKVAQTLSQSFKRPLSPEVKCGSIFDTFKKRCKSEETVKVTDRKLDEFVSITSKTNNKISSRSLRKTLSQEVDSFKRNYNDEAVKEADSKLDELVTLACQLTQEDEEVMNITVDNEEPSQSRKRNELPLKLDLTRIKQLLDVAQDSGEFSKKVKFRASEITPTLNQQAEEELNRHLTQKNFTEMQIIGQFNLGFIIAKLDSDLFLIDQHATDEKYNFEQLQKTTTLDSQKLVTPKLLELTAAAKSTLQEHEDIFTKNGFTFKNLQTDGGQVYLTSVPISERMVFGKGDIDEMLFMLQEDASNATSCRPSRIRDMFASRACRKSVMIGRALAKCEMRKLVDHMADIEQPWNCPHGRPTIRHLVNLDLIADTA